MDINTDIFAALPLAAMEAQLTNWDKIEPHHFLCAALKFVEINPRDLAQMLQDTNGADQLAVSKDKLKTMLNRKWRIEIPGGSSAFRRKLRRSGNSSKMPKPKMMHRSDASRKMFELAVNEASVSSKTSMDICDLVHVILSKPDEWILRIMKKLGLPLSPVDNLLPEKTISEWGDAIQLLVPGEFSNIQEKERIKADPVTVVLSDWISNPALLSYKPCLLINDSSRKGENFLHDVLKFRANRGLPYNTIASFLPTPLLEMVINPQSAFDISILNELIEAEDRNMLYFFASIYNYLSSEIVTEDFARSFRQWLKRTDGRFIFEISKKKYSELIKDSAEWKETFQLIWINDPFVIPKQFKL